MHRRRYLALVGGTTAGMAGCVGGDDLGGAERSDADELLFGSELVDDNPTLFADTTHSFSGEEGTITNSFELQEGFLVTYYRYDAVAGNFSIYIEGEIDARLVSTSASSDGVESANCAHVDSGEYLLDIRGLGDWEVVLAQPSPPDDAVRTAPVENTGTGSALLGPIELESGDTIRVEYDGTYDFSLGACRQDGSGTPEQFIRDRGPVLETIDVEDEQSGVYWIRIYSRGEWNLQVQDA